MKTSAKLIAAALLALMQCRGSAQSPAREGTLLAHLAITSSAPGQGRVRKDPAHAPPAVLWLMPLSPEGDPVFAAWKPHGGYRLLQRDRTFRPHLLVLPPGSTVAFPNADPFFHNVFSLFNGKRFDLGLYEAGSSKTVTFSRQGASYIFCNIHPEMSAVVLAVASPYFAIADTQGSFRLAHLPPGEYDVQLWVEGADEAQVAPLRRRLRIRAGVQDLGALALSLGAAGASHRNLYGEPYAKEPGASYGP